jgi:mannose-6-phosphate isomerase
MDQDIGAEIAHLSAWLRERAWPVWLAHGIDRARGGFFEALDLQTRMCSAEYRRLRVVARQTYVFAEAYGAGLAGADEVVRIGIDFLARHAVHPDGGYAWRFDLAHRPLDPTRDLYDHAFVLLALAASRAVLPADTLLPAALDLLTWIDTALAHPKGGFQESLPPSLPRRQNPHMHLLEALLAAHEAFGEAVFLDRATGIVDLFADRLFDRAAGALPEFFDDDLAPVCRNDVFLVEPGHHCEWVWLLHRFQAMTATRPDLQGISRRLMEFVDDFAIDPSYGGLIDIVASDGAPVERSGRLWPQTERVKAEFYRPDPSPSRQLSALRVLGTFIRPDGLWHERRSQSGAWRDVPAPASSLYHLTSAILTLEKLARAQGETTLPSCETEARNF